VSAPSPDAFQEKDTEPPAVEPLAVDDVNEPDSSVEIRRLTDRLTTALGDAMTGAVAVLERQSSTDRDKLSAAVTDVANVSLRLTELSRELAAQRQWVEGKVETVDALSYKLAGIESHIVESEKTERQLKEDHRLLEANRNSDRQQQERAVSGLADGIRGLEKQLQDQRDSAERRFLDGSTRMDQINERLDEIVHCLQAQAENIAGVSSAVSTLQQAHESTTSRLNLQAEAIRSLHAAAEKQGSHWEECLLSMRKAMQMASASASTATLPEQL
jgi:chromosome segregation ATPase